MDGEFDRFIKRAFTGAVVGAILMFAIFIWAIVMIVLWLTSK